MSTVRQQIWEDMKTYKTYLVCCRKYADKQRKWSRTVRLAVVLLTAVGAVLFFFSKWWAFISTLIPLLKELLSIYFPQFEQSEQELSELDKISISFEETLIDIEELWNRYEHDEIADSDATVLLSKLNKGQATNKAEMNRLVHKISDKEKAAYMQEADEYLQSKFYPIENEKEFKQSI